MHAPGVGARIFAVFCATFAACKGQSEASRPDADATDAGPSFAVTEAALPPGDLGAMRNPFDAAVYGGPFGSVEGTVTVTGDAPADTGLQFSKCPAAQAVYEKAFRVGADGALGDAVVALGASPMEYVPEVLDVQTVTIRDCSFGTRTIAMTVGQRLDVLNASNQIFGPTLQPLPVYALRVLAPKSDPIRFLPPRPGRYRLQDKLGHDFLTADVFVSPHPLHAVTDTRGHYRIDRVPVGTRQIQAFHPAIGDGPKAATAEIEIAANVVTRRDLQIVYRRDALDGGVAEGGASPPRSPSSKPATATPRKVPGGSR